VRVTDSRRRRSGGGRILVALSCLGVALGAAAAAWWLLGDLSYHRGDDSNVSYQFGGPRDLSTLQGLVLGVAGVLAAVLGAAYLIRATKAGRLQSKWWAVLLLFTCAGLLAALIERMATAGTVGANIGGGIAVFFGVPVVLALLLAALVLLGWLLHHDRTNGPWHKSRSEVPPSA
jgi:hypothetical protein